MCSVKDLTVIIKSTEDKPGFGKFSFSDRYSVFDWGAMPDQIEKKGKALCLISAYFFEKLYKIGAKSHYLGLFNEQGTVVSLDDLTVPSGEMGVVLYRVIQPLENKGIYDYSEYNNINNNFLIPLELIYRNTLPEGSSVFKRLNTGEIKPEDIGLLELPMPGMKLDKTILDVSTKLETIDRYISWQEALIITGLYPEEINEMKETTQLINNLITREVKRIGLSNEDGKIECALNEKDEIILVDVFGTPDECRFTYDGLHVSKELARNYYRNTEWYDQIEKAKKIDRKSWKSLVEVSPPHLPERLAILFSYMYQAVCNELTLRNWFEVPSLSEIMKDINIELNNKDYKN